MELHDPNPIIQTIQQQEFQKDPRGNFPSNRKSRATKFRQTILNGLTTTKWSRKSKHRPNSPQTNPFNPAIKTRHPNITHNSWLSINQSLNHQSRLHLGRLLPRWLRTLLDLCHRLRRRRITLPWILHTQEKVLQQTHQFHKSIRRRQSLRIFIYRKSLWKPTPYLLHKNRLWSLAAIRSSWTTSI